MWSSPHQIRWPLPDLVQPRDRGAVTSVPERLQRFVPACTEQLVQVVRQMFARTATADEGTQLILAHDDVTVRTGTAAPKAQPGRETEPLAVNAGARLL